MIFRMVLAAALISGGSYPLAADQLRYDSARDWRQCRLGSGRRRDHLDAVGHDPANAD